MFHACVITGAELCSLQAARRRPTSRRRVELVDLQMETDIYYMRRDRPHHTRLELLGPFAATVAAVPGGRVQRFPAPVRPVLRGRVHGQGRVPAGAHGRPEGMAGVRRH